MKKRISLIAAMAANRSIGIDGRLPWHLPADLKHFKALTMGHTMVMGRKTYESISAGPLPGRSTIVITHQAGYSPPGVRVAHSLDEALALAEGEEVFVAGGEEIFRLALDQGRADRMYLTRIEKDYPGDTFFPEFDESAWKVVEREDFPATERNPAFTFLTLDRHS
jgi:dihydrofolate reductase